LSNESSSLAGSFRWIPLGQIENNRRSGDGLWLVSTVNRAGDSPMC